MIALHSKEAEASNVIKNETLAQVFSCEFSKFSKKTCSYRTPPAAGSDSTSVSGNIIFKLTHGLFESAHGWG